MSVRNALVLFLALSTLSLLVGCGSSGQLRYAASNRRLQHQQPERHLRLFILWH